MWQLTPPYEAHWYICLTANKCSHKYDLIAGMDISEAKRADVRRSLFDPLYTVKACSQWSLVEKRLTLSLELCSSFQLEYLRLGVTGLADLACNLIICVV